MIKNTITVPVSITPPYDTKLSPHFTLKEMCLSGTAIKHGWKNTPDALAVMNLTKLCENVLEPLRLRFGVIRITSGYRSKQVNDAVGGVEFSQHRYGEAADIYVPNAEIGHKMFDYIRHNTEFDQLIYEYIPHTGRQWIHVSHRTSEPNRRKAIMNYEMASDALRAKR